MFIIVSNIISKWRVVAIKNIPNIITLSRIVLSFALLFVKPQTLGFFLIYAACGITDFLDGYIARKGNLTTNFGATLDSIADFIFACIILFIYLPILKIPFWSFVCIVIIFIIRFSSLMVGFSKYKKLAFLHTYANKLTGFLLFSSPLLLLILGMNVTCFTLCMIAGISAIEELAINLISPKLVRDKKSIFQKQTY